MNVGINKHVISSLMAWYSRGMVSNSKRNPRPATKHMYTTQGAACSAYAPTLLQQHPCIRCQMNTMQLHV